MQKLTRVKLAMHRKCVLITGGSRGIGRAIAKQFAINGYNVGIGYLSNDKDALLTKNELLDLNADAEIFKFDISKPDKAKELMNAFIERFGRIDTLVNNAGIASITPISDISNDNWDKMISTNLSSAFYLSKASLPYFLKNKAGNIINISSMWASVGASCEVAYTAAKAGLVGFTKALAKELGPSNIRVNCISPGFIDTEMNNTLSADDFELFKNETPLLRLGKPEDIAPLAVFLASSDASFITGANFHVDGGYI